MNENHTIRCLSLFSLIGVLTGLVIDRLVAYNIYYISPYLFISAWALLFALAYDERHTTRLIISSMIATLFICFPLLLFNFNHHDQFSEGSLFMLVSLPFYAYVIHSFHHALHLESRITFSYTALYNTVWHTYIVIILATIFACIANTIVQVSAWGFGSLGFDFLTPILNKIRYPYYSFMLFFGLGITKPFQKLTNQIRLLILKMAYYLYPIIMVLTSLYLVLFFIKHPLYNIASRNVSGYETLFPLVVIGILSFNAFFRDGETEHGNLILSYLSKAYRVVLFISALIVTIQTCLNNTLNLNIELYLLIMMMFTAIYAVSIFMTLKKEISFIQKGNIVTALFYLLATIIIYNPSYPLTSTSVLAPPLQLGPGLTPQLNPSKPIDITTRLKQMDSKLMTLGLSWIPSTAMIANFLNAGVCPSEKQGICRVKYQDGYQIGRWSQNECIITYAGQSIPFPNAEILIGASDKIQWRANYFAPQTHLALGLEPVNTSSPRELVACRALTQKHVLIGKLVDGRCNIAVNNKEQLVDAVFQVLAKKT